MQRADNSGFYKSDMHFIPPLIKYKQAAGIKHLIILINNYK